MRKMQVGPLSAANHSMRTLNIYYSRGWKIKEWDILLFSHMGCK